MAEFINTIDVLGDDAVVDGIINRSITEFKDDTITEIGAYAFDSCSALKVVEVPLVSKVGGYAFRNCSTLYALELPEVTVLPTYLVQGCSALETFIAPKATKCDWAFSFQDLSKLKTVSIENVTSYDSSSFFRGCKSLESISLPKVTALAASMFYGCTMLKTVNMPNAVSVPYEGFRGCSSIEKLDLPKLNVINGWDQFNGCSKLKALILRNTATVCTLNYSRTFNGTPIDAGTGYIYVPSALVDSYKTATNWANYADRIRAVEDYTVDGTITGELDETKI